ncbi:MAG: DUF72 domain-containing protein [Myxococcales bacterium]|nr:DUF72 domain-containing protein [Myxococcales bacterium]
MIERIYMGLPIWNRADWTGELFAPGTPAGQRLAAYARSFNAVEGNTTFYAVPPAATVARWVEQTSPGFRFCFKLPRTITHDRLLVNARREVEVFMEVLEPLGPRLGPVLVQLPPRFGPRSLPTLEDFLLALPPGAPYAVEVRHPGYFEGAAAQELDAMLGELGIDRVILDTRGVHEAEGDDPALVEAHRRKPRLPAPAVATASRPVLRYVANPELPANDARLSAWADQVVAWLEQGREPYLFMHVPNDFHAPALARRFFAQLSARTDVGSLPGWVGERRRPRQVGLFELDEG